MGAHVEQVLQKLRLDHAAQPRSNTTDGANETFLAWAWDEYPDGFPVGSWGCRAKVDGKVVGELSFSTAR